MSIVQVIVLALFTGLMSLFCSLAITGLYNPILFGVFTGIVVGDIGVGLEVGASCALMSLGFYTYGGSVTPDYTVGCMFGVVVAHMTGDPAEGIVIGSIVALLMPWFNILGRTANTIFQHMGDKALANRNIKAFERSHLSGAVMWAVCRSMPVLIGMLVIDRYMIISDFVSTYAWIKTGMLVVGNSLPAVGFALLLSYMDIKNYWPFMLIGYVLYAFMGVPTLGLCIFGAALAALFTVFINKKTGEEAE